LGVIHKNLSIQAQAQEVEKVKRFEHGVITTPITLGPDASVQEAVDLMKNIPFRVFPSLKATS